MYTESETGHIANNITREVEKHVLGKAVRRMCDLSLLWRKGTPLMISRAFAVALSWMCVTERCPILQVPLPEIDNKTAEVNGFTILQLFLEHVGLCLIIHGR